MTIKEVDERIYMIFDTIIEHMDHKFEQLIEAMDMMIDRKLQPVANDVATLKIDIETVELVVKETNQNVRDLKQRVTKIERIIEQKYE